MKEKNYKILFAVLILFGAIMIIVPFFGILSGNVLLPSSSTPIIEFTGYHATLFTLGILAIIFAVIIKIKKLPKIKIFIEK